MPGARSRVKPLSAVESSGSSASDEVSQLELHLQRQLEEDVARIFDESIYSDLEVVCGKLKILTHSCILKARTHKFYHKLEAILHVNIASNTFDEIYSFISDAYTECNIQHQEKEIIDYLNENLNLVKSETVKNSPKNNSEEKDDPDVYSTPNCVSPEEKSLQKTLASSPSTELTKEYYALVPIEENILDKELIEQDALSNAFQSINKTQTDDINGIHNIQCVKPTSLFIKSSHVPKINKHSNSCDILRDSDLKSIDLIKKVNDFDAKKLNNTSQHNSNKRTETDKAVDTLYKKSNVTEASIDKSLDPTYSPDSLITDEHSSSSDYLSAAYAVSPAASTSGISQLNVGENATKMENIITISDSGLETTGMLESLNSHKDVTLTDVSLTESTFQDMINDDANCHDSAPNNLEKNHIQQLIRSTSVHSPTSSTSTGKDLHDRRSNKTSLTEMSGTSTKEEKQRQNEEIVILESSSLSSETGSWESVFPPKLPEKDLCEKFITSERQSALEIDIRSKPPESSYIRPDSHDDLCPSLVQKSPFKSSSCFIDAASLADEGDDVITVHTETNECKATAIPENALPEASRPVPCVFKRDLSPNDWSESNDNEDSLEQADNKDPDSIQKDMSPTIFEMTPITEDSLCANTFEAAAETVQHDQKAAVELSTDTKNPGGDHTSLPNAFSTPNNSIISVGGGAPDFKMYESEESESDATITRRDTNLHHIHRFEEVSKTTPRAVLAEEYNRLKNSNDSPIISGGMSIEDHLPQLGSSHSGSPSTKRKIENIPIVSGAYIPEVEEKPEKPPKAPSNASAWVVDMSSSPKSDISECSVKQNKKPVDKSFMILRSASKSTSSVENCKSRSSVDSDSSEKSTHKFYIDLSTLPDALAPVQKQDGDDSNEKKNIFSMFIDLGDKSTTVKEMPARLSSSLNTKKTVRTESKCTNSKGSKTTKVSSLTSVVNHTDDSIMFEKLESLCNDPNISISEIISNPGSHTEDVNELTSSVKENEIITKVIKEEPTQDDSFDLFVKLSDLDKPKTEATTLSVKKECNERMTRSIPDNDWRESSQTINSRSIDIISSFHSENALSLNRLFPHLKNDFSRSMPGSLSSRTMSPLRIGVSSSPQILDIDEHASDNVSEMSSVQSSYCRSVVENSTTEETSQTSSLISNCQSRLGQDLLRMFLEEIAPDVIVEVSGRRIKAHKCILSSRCQYFAGILSGGWVESAGNVIALPPFSFSVVHFALCHIYSGVSMIPDSISIVELATIADMLGLEGLKEAIMFTLKAKYCHHFHKPCAVCTAGVLECFPLSSVYGLDDLYRKCLRWITKHFHKVWPTKAFATLPSELLDKCYQEHIVNLTTENIVETVYGCGITVASLHNSRWSETVARMCRRLVNAAAHFAAPRLSAILRAAAAAALPPDAPPPALQALDDCVAAAIEWAPPDEACRAYAFLSALVKEIRLQHYAKPDLISGGAAAKAAAAGAGGALGAHAAGWRLQCEGALVRAAPRVVGTQAFKDLPPDLRKRLRELGCIMFGGQAAPAGASPQPARKTRSAGGRRCAGDPAAARSLDIDRVRASFVPYASKPQPPATATDPPPPPVLTLGRPNKTFPPRVRTTKAQEERAKYNLIKTVQSQEKPGSKALAAAPVAARAAYEHAKPRYLEPRSHKDERKPPKKPQPKMVSSSESSRNSSPIQARGMRASRVGRAGAAAAAAAVRAHVSHDSLASRPRTADPSTDSLSESQNSNKYATYTKAKHTTKGSIESVTSHPPVKCHSINNSTNKVKTKIPVYLNQGSKSCTAVSASSRDAQRRVHEKSLASSLSPIAAPRNKANERKPSGSLMNATKSSQAKMVPKIVKETQNKYASKHDKPCKGKHTSCSPPLNEIPVMERSGTFLKDEPMFGDKTTDIDIDE